MLTKKLKKQELLNAIYQMGEELKFPLIISNPTLPNEPIVYVNAIFTKIIGHTNEEIIGKSKSTLLQEYFKFHVDNKEVEGHLIDYTFDNAEILLKRDASNSWYEYSEHKLFNHKNKHKLNMSFLFDITKHKEEFNQLSFFDPISELTNYHYFTDQISKKVEANSTGFILLIQPGDYDNIVDAFGKNQLGNLHKELYKRVSEVLKDIPTVISRATEGSLIVAGLCEERDIKMYVDFLLKTVNDPFVINDFELFISLKIGATSLKNFNGNVDESVRLANIALSQSKKQAGNSIVYYEENFSKDLKEKILIQNELVHAIRSKDIKVHLQPKVNVVDEKIVSFEALARWSSPKFGQVPPIVFIEAAESIGMIEDLDFLIIEQVLNWLHERKQRNLPLYQVSVNISPSHFYTHNFTEKLSGIVEQYGILPQFIKIELTENIGLVDLEKAKQIIHDLKLLGFESSVDDFGIGFSSLSYLHQLPVNELKIDRSFINNLTDNGGNAIVKTIIQLAKSMDLTAVAEGIESEEQLEVIREMNCQVAQGYYFYKPMSLDQIEELLTNDK